MMRLLFYVYMTQLSQSCMTTPQRTTRIEPLAESILVITRPEKSIAEGNTQRLGFPHSFSPL